MTVVDDGGFIAGSVDGRASTGTGTSTSTGAIVGAGRDAIRIPRDRPSKSWWNRMAVTSVADDWKSVRGRT